MSGPTMLVVALCAALNLALGSIVYMVKLPIYLDLVGTLLCALLLAATPMRSFMASAAVGIISFVLGGALNPFLPWFSGTAVAVAAVAAFVVSRSSVMLRQDVVASARFIFSVLGYGILLGVVAAIVSAPVVVYLFGGVTGSGSAVLIAFFVKAGNQLLNAALLSGMAAEPVDKTLQLIVAVSLFRATPESLIVRLRHT